MLSGKDESVPIMEIKDLTARINDASKIARELHDLLHEDALHRLQLYHEYSADIDDSKWTPDLYLRCHLVESLCRKLSNSDE